MKQKTNGIWIPEEIWLDKSLSFAERVFLSKVLALSEKDGSCWAGDDKLSDYLTISPSYIRRLIKKLKESKYIEVEGYGQGRKIRVSEEVQNGTSANRNKCETAQKLCDMEQELVQNRTKLVRNRTHTIEHTKELTKEPTKERSISSSSRFQKPTLSESMEIFELAGSSRDEGEKYWNYYESNGWKAGRNQMKDWKAAARNWIKRSHEFTNNRKSTKSTPDLDRDKLAEYIRTGIVPSN